MDLDTTVKGFTLTQASITEIFKEICNVRIDDNITFEFIGTTDIRETDDYPGIRVSLKANYAPVSVPLTVDVTTGDAITPKEIKYHHRSAFDNKVIHVLAYNLETILSEKITKHCQYSSERLLRYLYFIFNPYVSTLRDAVDRTSHKRGSTYIITEYQSILDSIKQNKRLIDMWNKYSTDYEYARGISFEMACDAISKLLIKMYDTAAV